MKRILKLLKQPKLIIIYLLNTNLFNFIGDKTFLKLKYKILMNRSLDLKSPTTFNEKLQWLKLYDRNPKYTKMVDKFDAKEYVSEIIGEQYIIPTIGIYGKFEDIDFEVLPEKFVIKCTHDSGGVVICKNKKQFDIVAARKKINKSLRKNYYYSCREWPYKNIKPRIIIEQLIEVNGLSNEDLMDYKFMCFNGKVECSFVCTNRYSKEGLNVTFFDKEWQRMPFERHYPADENNINKPENYELMIQLAEKLSMDIPFVRVDFYEVNGKIYFGELTFFPGSGMEEFTPEEWDYKLGLMLKLPKNEYK